MASTPPKDAKPAPLADAKPAPAPVAKASAPVVKPASAPAAKPTPAAVAKTSPAPVAKPPVAAPKAATPKPVAAPAPKPAPVVAKPVPAPTVAKPEPKPVEAVEAVVEKVAEVVKPVAAVAEAVTQPVSAAVATPPADKAAAKPVSKSVAPKIIETIEPAVSTAKAVVTKEVSIMEAQIKNVADKAKTLLTDANAKSTKAFGEVNDFTKGNIEAFVESGKIAAKGVEAMGQDTADFTRRQFETATATLKSLSTVKSPTDFFKLQGDYMRSSFDAMVAQTSKNTEAMLKLAGDVAQPIQNRVSVAVEKVKVAA